MLRKARGVPLETYLESIRADRGIAPSKVSRGELKSVPIALLRTGRFQPRKVFPEREIAALTESVRQSGIVQPLVVRPIENGRFEIVAGERRWRAAARAELVEVPVIVQDLDDATTLAVTLIENIQREDLNPIDEAEAIARLLDECQLTHGGVAEVLGKSREGVTNLLRLRDLEPAVREHVRNKRLSLGHAKVLLGAAGDEQVALAERAVENEMSVRALEAALKKLLQPPVAPAAKANTVEDERLATSRLGVPASISLDSRGRGRIVLRVKTMVEYRELMRKLSGTPGENDH